MDIHNFWWFTDSTCLFPAAYPFEDIIQFLYGEDGMDGLWIEESHSLRCDVATNKMSRWKLGSMLRINGLFHLLINGTL